MDFHRNFHSGAHITSGTHVETTQPQDSQPPRHRLHHTEQAQTEDLEQTHHAAIRQPSIGMQLRQTGSTQTEPAKKHDMATQFGSSLAEFRHAKLATHEGRSQVSEESAGSSSLSREASHHKEGLAKLRYKNEKLQYKKNKIELHRSKMAVADDMQRRRKELLDQHSAHCRTVYECQQTQQQHLQEAQYLVNEH